MLEIKTQEYGFFDWNTHVHRYIKYKKKYIGEIREVTGLRNHNIIVEIKTKRRQEIVLALFLSYSEAVYWIEENEEEIIKTYLEN